MVEIPETRLKSFAKAYGFKDVDARVSGMLVRLAKKLSRNLIANAKVVSDACNCKSIRASHFKAVGQLMNRIQESRRAQMPAGSQSGGGDYHMPAVYFNPISDPAYVSLEMANANVTFADSAPDLTRAAHDIKIVGGAGVKSLFSDAAISKLAEEINKAKTKPVKISQSAIKVMRESIEQNIRTLVKHAADSKISVKLTQKLLAKMIETHPQFAHMR